MTRTGGCACGAIRFEAQEPFIGIGACHCTDCQKASGGGPNYVALVPKAALTILSGNPRLHTRPGSSGAPVSRAFCGDCGTPLWGIPPHEPFYTVKLGAFDQNDDLVPGIEIFTASSPAWHPVIAGVPSFPRMPPPR